MIRLRRKVAAKNRSAASGNGTPHLELRGPLAVAGVVLGVAAAGLSTLAASTTLERGRSIEAYSIDTMAPLDIVHGRGGVLAQLHVKAGDEIARGDIIASFDTKALEGRIAELRAAVNATQSRLDPVRNRILELGTGAARPEASALVATLKSDLESQVAEIERERIDLAQRIAETERQIADGVVRAPAAGRVLAVMPAAQGQYIAPASALATLSPRLTGVAVAAPSSQVARLDLEPGMSIRIWPADPAAGDLVPASANVVRVASHHNPHEGHDVTQILLDLTAADRAGRPRLGPGHAVRIMAPAPNGQVLDALFAPFTRQPVSRSRGAKPEDAK